MNEQMYGAEKLRAVVGWINWQNETFLDRFSPTDLIALWEYGQTHPAEVNEFADTRSSHMLIRTRSVHRHTQAKEYKIAEAETSIRLGGILFVVTPKDALAAKSFKQLALWFDEDDAKEVALLEEAIRHFRAMRGELVTRAPQKTHEISVARDVCDKDKHEWSPLTRRRGMHRRRCENCPRIEVFAAAGPRRGRTAAWRQATEDEAKNANRPTDAELRKYLRYAPLVARSMGIYRGDFEGVIDR